MSLNKAIVIGFVGKDPDVRALQSGAKVASFSVATAERWRDKATGERKEKTDWHRVVCFNENLAKVIEQHVHKGSRIYVEGKMQTRKYTDKDGIERYTTEIVLSSFHAQLVLLDKGDGGKAPPPAASEAEYGTSSTRSAERSKEELDDEIPF